MKNFQDYFDVFPRIVPADQVSEIRIIPRFPHAELPALENITVHCLPVDGLTEEQTHLDERDRQKLLMPENAGKQAVRSAEIRDGALVLRIFFAGEQEHNLTLDLHNLPARLEAEPWVSRDLNGIRFNLYSLRPDLMRLRPYKGDFHLHSLCSDGKESPEYVAARYREEGFDFIAVTDHGKYEPSLRAMAYWNGLKNGFRLYPGEEVHVPDGRVHIINFGGSFSVNELAKNEPERYRREVDELIRALPEGLVPDGENPYPVAASEWAFERIREGGGLAMFCHPYWQVRKYEISELVTDIMFRRKKFDIFEVIGGFYEHQWRSNNCQIARYYGEIAKGSRFPVAGVSDSHGTDCDQLAFRNFTVVLAESDELADLISAMKAGQCAAVEIMGGKIPHVVGEFRLVKYISFLIQDYFPAQTRLCSVEGALMLEMIAGNENARTALNALGNRVETYRNRSFGGAAQ